MELGVPELLIILVIVILLFGVGRIGKIAGELGTGIRNFREALQGEEHPVESIEPQKEGTTLPGEEASKSSGEVPQNTPS